MFLQCAPALLIKHATMELYKHSLPFVRLTVLKRPSAIIKSPYVADVVTDDGRTGLCHTPGLGCCGLVENGRIIYGTASSDSAKTDWTAQVAECSDSEGIYYVGIHPMVSQAVAHGLLDRVWAGASWKSEVVVEEGTRLDYVGTVPCAAGADTVPAGAGTKKVYVEVKTAMISVECDKPRTERRAVFPEGFRKKKTDTVSPRAVKHAELLGNLCSQHGVAGSVLVYMVPRSDCGGGLELNALDPTYCAAVRSAMCKGMIVRAFAVDYTLDGRVCLAGEVPFYWPAP